MNEEEYSALPSAIADEGDAIGKGASIWHFADLCRGAWLGEHCMFIKFHHILDVSKNFRMSEEIANQGLSIPINPYLAAWEIEHGYAAVVAG